MSAALYLHDLVERDGIFYSKGERVIHYPNNGSNSCFEVENESFWFEHRKKCILELVSRTCKGQVFFDIGGGNGVITKHLEDNGISAVLIEPGINGCINAKNRGVKTVICSTIEDVHVDPNSIHGVGLFDVLEHIDDDNKFLFDLNKLVETDGVIIVTVPAYGILWSEDDARAGHFRRYSISELESKIKDAGFDVEYSTYIFSVLVLAILLFRTIPSRLGLRGFNNRKGKTRKEHIVGGVVSRIIRAVCNAEFNRIKSNKRIAFGSSCLAIAKKREVAR
jgi:SAM-dependent methyltransferase